MQAFHYICTDGHLKFTHIIISVRNPFGPLGADSLDWSESK